MSKENSLIDNFEKLSDKEKHEFKTNHTAAYLAMFSSGDPTSADNARKLSGAPAPYTPSDVKTVDDFEKLSDSQKFDFKTKNNAAYVALFKGTNLAKPVAAPGNLSTATAPYNVSDIKTADDFEKLTAAQQMDFKSKYNNAYLNLFGLGIKETAPITAPQNDNRNNNDRPPQRASFNMIFGNSTLNL